MPAATNDLPYWEIRFDDSGGLTDDGGLRAAGSVRDLTDLYVFAHGWNNSEASARDLYRAMFGLLADDVRGSGARVGTVGVFWPSLVFPEDDPTAAPMTSATGQEVAEALHPAFAPVQRKALDKLGALVDARPDDPERLREAHQAIADLVTSPDLGAVEDAGEKAILTGSTAAVFGHFAGMTKTPGDAQGAG